MTKSLATFRNFVNLPRNGCVPPIVFEMFQLLLSFGKNVCSAWKNLLSYSVISYSEGFEPQPGEINRETADKLGLCI
jgi:hypothetical protein